MRNHRATAAGFYLALASFTGITTLLGTGPAAAQTVTLPQSVVVAKGRMAAVKITFDGDDLRWDVPPQLDCFREFSTDPKDVRLRLIGYDSGTYRLTAVTCKGGKLSDFATCLIVVGDGPGPVPPNPPDPIPPTPVPPANKVAWVVVVQDVSKRTPAQAALLADAKLWGQVEALGCKWRVYDDDQAGRYKDTIAKTGLPCLLTMDAAGKVIVAAPLPATADKVLQIVREGRP